MLIGSDSKQILERRFQAAGCRVITASDNEVVFERVRHEFFDMAVLVSRGSLLNVAETIFNLRDLNDSMEIVIVVERLGKSTNRYLRQLMEHPIEGTRILTRRELQRELHVTARSQTRGNPA